MSYYDIYQKRLSKYGTNPQARLQNKRAAAFVKYMEQSGYKASLTKGTNTYNVVLEPNKQDETKTTGALLTELDLDLEQGEIYTISGYDWMIFYADLDISRGYNKYIVLKMTHLVKWHTEGTTWSSSKAYYFGNMTGIIKDMSKSFNQNPIYDEKDKNNHIIMPRPATTSANEETIKKDDYVRVFTLDGTKEIVEDFLVTGFDQVSVPGVIYITVNQTMRRETPTVDTNSSSDSWFNEV